MQTVGDFTLSWHDYPADECVGGAVSVGNFDGVHLGHRALFAAAGALARPVVALTFDPPPLRVLSGEPLAAPLTALSERVELLREAGADRVAILRTSPELLALSPEAFFEEILQRRFRARAIVEGFNFRFGRSRGGSVETLRELCAAGGIVFEAVAPVLDDGEPISSSRIRAGLLAGNVEGVARWLGHAYHIRGRVVEGAKRGRTIGFPTANLAGVETLLPAEGVYAVRALLDDGSAHPAAANVGANPTFGEEARKIEVHLIDFVGDLYGRPMRVEFVERLRATQPFDGVAALVEQLHRDVEAARRVVRNQETR